MLLLNAALASVAFIGGSWLYFYVDRIPVARQVHDEAIVAKPGSEVVIGGLNPGPLLSINLRTGGRLRLSIDDGAKILSPTTAELAAAPSSGAVGGIGHRTILDIFKSGNGNAGLDLELRASAPTAVELVPIPTEDGRNGFRITPQGGTLLAHALMIGGNEQSPEEMTLMSAAGTAQWDEATIAIPSGKTAEILADDPADGSKRATVIELPVYSSTDPQETGVLEAGSAAVRQPDAQAFDSAICAAVRPGQKRFWPIIFPAVNLLECVPGKLALSNFNPFGEISLTATGNAFLMRDGKPEFWKGPSLVIQNPVIAEVIHKSIIPALLAWVGLSFKALWTRRRRS